MIVTVRRVENSHTHHEFFAYAKSICGKATYFLYFTDDIWGAMVLHNFVEMLRLFFKKETIELKLHDDTLHLKNDRLLNILRDENGKNNAGPINVKE